MYKRQLTALVVDLVEITFELVSVDLFVVLHDFRDRYDADRLISHVEHPGVSVVTAYPLAEFRI